MKLFVELPSWLGDAVMATPAIENLVRQYDGCELIIFGSFVSTRLFQHHPNVVKIIVDNSKQDGNRYINLYKLAKSVGQVDTAFSFRKHFSTKFLLFFIQSYQKFIYKRYTTKQRHQVLRYNDFINRSLSIKTKPSKLTIFLKETLIKDDTKQILGLNPGATYGSAKRWYPSEFAKVAVELSKQYDIVIFGSQNEIEIANDIEVVLQQNNISNYQNLAGKTSVEELIQHIANLDLFITNDSGPMHIAAAFSIPTVAIFGPTKYQETHQWQNRHEMIVKKDFDCMPCMKRVCPLKGEQNHQCMKTITAQDILDKLQANIFDNHKKKKVLQDEFKQKHNIPTENKLILFKAKNFKQNGIDPYLEIISEISVDKFKAIVCGDNDSLKYAMKKAKKLKIEDKIIFLNDISIKTADIFVLPTSNKKFAINVLEAMRYKAIVFAPRQNEATIKLLDIFATMDTPTESNTAHKIDALLNNNDFAQNVQKENKKKALEFLALYN